MKVKKEQSDANRAALLKAAGPLFREKGIDGVGVAELCKSAGLTHGALYSHFESKAALAAEALTEGHKASAKRMEDAIGATPSLKEIIDFYVSPRHRESVQHCCPLLAASSEAARQERVFQESYVAAFKDICETLEHGSARTGKKANATDSMVLAASMIGIVAVARALQEVEPEISDRLLSAAQKTLGK